VRDPDSDDVDRVEQALGWRPDTWWTAVQGRADSSVSTRWIVSKGRRRAFVKLGSSALTASWIRTEHANYRDIAGPFVPRLLGWSDDGARPVLALEDLSGERWPPPWDRTAIDAVVDALERLHGLPPLARLPPASADMGANWSAVADEPEPFLGLGLCTASWLDDALPSLIAAQAAAPLDGTSILHLDVRSDNLCLRDRQALLVDWNLAALGNPDVDVAFWLPSLESEGGPRPDLILPHAPELAAWVAGYFCSRAGAAPLPDAPHVRPLQRVQAGPALAWAARALRLGDPLGA
jgi:hypothetical protein